MKSLRILLTLVTLLAVTTSLVSANLVSGPCACLAALEASASPEQAPDSACCSDTSWTSPSEPADTPELKLSPFDLECWAEQECACAIAGCANLPGDILTKQSSPIPNRSQQLVALVPELSPSLCAFGGRIHSRASVSSISTISRPLFLSNAVFRL